MHASQLRPHDGVVFTDEAVESVKREGGRNVDGVWSVVDTEGGGEDGMVRLSRGNAYFHTRARNLRIAVVEGTEDKRPMAVFNIQLGPGTLASTTTRLVVDLTDEEMIVLRYLVLHLASDVGDPLKDIYEVVPYRSDARPNWYLVLKALQGKFEALPKPSGER